MSQKGKTKQMWNSVQAEDLQSAYRTSLQQNPQFHDPQVVDGSADETTRNYDFLSWCGGVRSCIADSRLNQYLQQNTQMQGQQSSRGYKATIIPNVPDNVRQALSGISGSMQTRTRNVRSIRRTA